MGLASGLAEAIARARAGADRDWLGVPGEALAALDPGAAGHLYEALLAARAGTRRKRLGAFYTPPGLAAALVRLALPGAWPAGAPPRVIDPACGAGAFLLAAARHLAGRLEAPDPEAARRLAARALHGVDRDAGALAVCRAVLAADGFDLPPGALRHADALARPWDGRFDAVVGNPPYVNIVRLPDAERAALRARFSTFRNKCDLYGLFVEAAADHLVEGGRLAFVLSDSFVGADSFAPLRRLLFSGEKLRATAVLTVRGPAFDAAVNPVVVVARRTDARDAAGELTLGSLDAAGVPGPLRLVPADAVARTAERSAALCLDPDLLARSEVMRARGTPLGALMSFSLGVKTGDDARFVGAAPRGPSWVRCARGRSVGAWRVEDDGFLDYRPEALRAVHGARPRRRESFDRPLKILLRETSGARLIAAMDRARRFPLDTLHVLHAPDDRPAAVSIWAVLAVLNAAPTSGVYGRLHPGAHVKAAEVRALPMPPLPPTDEARWPGAAAAAVAWVAAGGPGPAPAACLAPGVRHRLLELLGRWLTDAAAAAPARRAAAQRLIDAAVEAAWISPIPTPAGGSPPR